MTSLQSKEFEDKTEYMTRLSNSPPFLDLGGGSDSKPESGLLRDPPSPVPFVKSSHILLFMFVSSPEKVFWIRFVILQLNMMKTFF